MKFPIKGKIVDKPCFWVKDNRLELIDQRKLPSEVELIEAVTISEQIECIRTLAVRGAPAIGAFGACSLALAVQRGEDAEEAYGSLLVSRPTAVDLRNCLDRVKAACDHGKGVMKEAYAIYDKIIDSCRMIGEHGVEVIGDDARVMTHCNAGALASLDWGTALAPIRLKAREGGNPFVWVSETRPLLQGARLTAWELLHEGIDHRIIVDGASGHLMREGKVDLVITGTDRVCRNGDFANKIGTYEKAVLAKENKIPFYIAFPSTTIDRNCDSGEEIPIEERGAEEVLKFRGADAAPYGSSAFNPAFDVTPAKYVTGYITENGVFDLDGLKERMEE